MNLRIACQAYPRRKVLIKTLLVMKLTIFLLTAFLLNARANGISQTITWSGKNVSLEKVFSAIKKQTGYFVFYNHDLLRDARKVTLDLKNVSLEETLRLCFKNQPLNYEIEHRTIVVVRKQPPNITNLLPVVVQDTTREVRGTVVDEKGEPVSGATIIVAGTTIGTSANTNGEFSLRVPNGRGLVVISSVGHESKEVPISKSNTMGIVLKEKLDRSDDVVVIGYGSVKKSDLTGSVSSISKKDLGDRQVSDIGSLIQGRAAGVDVSQGTIRVRGITTFNNTDPLVVIDGFIGGNQAAINPNDIESVEILKDASSTAIYGSRGANGVILITTRSGKGGPMKIGLSYYEGISQVPRKLDVLNGAQYGDYVLDILEKSGTTPTDKVLSDEIRQDRTKWQDEVFKTGHNRELNLNFSGGSDKSTFFVSMGYRKNANPTFLGLKEDNLYFRLKNTYNIKKWLRFGNNFAFNYRSYKGGGEYGNPGNMDHAINAPQYFPVKDESGEYSLSDRNTDIVEFSNPITTAVHNHLEGRGINYQAALWAEIEPLKGLTYKVQASASGEFGLTQNSNDSYTGGIAGNALLPTKLSKGNYWGFSPLIEQYITYQKSIGLHDFSVMVGNTWQNGSAGGRTGIRGQGLDLAINSVLTAPTNLVIEDAISKYAYLSYFGRINYQLNDKYLLTLNMRTDASPRFAPGNRWATFPSVAVAWKLHEETFIKQLNVFDQLKLRLQWGISGNDDIGDFRYVSRVYTNNVYYPFGADGARVNGATILENASSDIQWESTESSAVGLDLAFFQNKLNLSIEYYNKNTRDILYPVPRATSLGYGSSTESGSATVNAASMTNKGFELAIGYRSRIGQLGYAINGNYTHNKNEVTSLGDGSYLDAINRTDIGHPIGYFYGFVADGIFMNQKELDAANSSAAGKGFSQYQLATTKPGDVRFIDINGDGHVTNDDRTYIGSPHAPHLFGLNLTLDFKGFDFNILIQGLAGSKSYDASYDRIRGGNYVLNQSTYVLNRWVSETESGNGIVPRAVIGDPAENNRPSTLRLNPGKLH